MTEETQVAMPLPKFGWAHRSEAVDHLAGLRLGDDIELVVVCRPVAKGFTTTTKGDDAEDVANYSVKVKVREVAPAA